MERLSDELASANDLIVKLYNKLTELNETRDLIDEWAIDRAARAATGEATT